MYNCFYSGSSIFIASKGVIIFPNNGYVHTYRNQSVCPETFVFSEYTYLY